MPKDSQALSVVDARHLGAAGRLTDVGEVPAGPHETAGRAASRRIDQRDIVAGAGQPRSLALYPAAGQLMPVCRRRATDDRPLSRIKQIADDISLCRASRVNRRVACCQANFIRSTPPAGTAAAIGWAAEGEIRAHDTEVGRADVHVVGGAIAISVSHERAAVRSRGASLRRAAIARVRTAIAIAIGGAGLRAAGSLQRRDASDLRAGVNAISQTVAIAVQASPSNRHRARAQVGEALIAGLDHVSISRGMQRKGLAREREFQAISGDRRRQRQSRDQLAAKRRGIDAR